ncbi:hypothetical protein QLX08_008031 [Tetragonisca angustula]|uniref:Uncharacterized protein n=1 Tax=Tetragonisca angustula TaxID=166442 RepID=A0AAW0ZPS7_9HYME
MNWKHGSYEVEEDGDEDDEEEEDDDDDDDNNGDEHDRDEDDERLLNRRSTRREFRYRSLTATRFSRKLTNQKHADWRKMADPD